MRDNPELHAHYLFLWYVAVFNSGINGLYLFFSFFLSFLFLVRRLVSAAVNSLYSFYWDIVYDWDLGHRGSTPTHYLLRDHLVFRNPTLYYAAAALDLTLRLSWSIRFSSIKLTDDLTMFLFELLEVSRRCMWIFLRVEYQFLKEQGNRPTTSKNVQAGYEVDSDDDGSMLFKKTGTT